MVRFGRFMVVMFPVDIEGLDFPFARGEYYLPRRLLVRGGGEGGSQLSEWLVSVDSLVTTNIGIT
jgi:hypothetical protein